MNREMRRQDRKATDPKMIAEVLDKATVMHLGLVDAGRAYVVPLNYGWLENDGHYTLYAHSAQDGRKIDLIGDGAEVGFEMDCGVAYFYADKACGYGNRFQSIIGEGKAVLCQTAEEKRIGLTAIMQHYSNRGDWTFEDSMVAHVHVIKIEVSSLSCKLNM